MANAAPRIGVTGPRSRYPIAWWATAAILRWVGARPVHLVPGQQRALHHSFDAIVIGGGDDIDAALYGETNPELTRLDPERDAYEVAIIESALEERVPLLGICRGMQLLNVVLGGSLYGDIRGQRSLTPNKRSPFPVKDALVTGDGRLGRIMSGTTPRTGTTETYRINSLHHQAIDRLGRDVKVVARDRDGFVQSIESTTKHFVMGTQWHPEYLPYLSAQRRIFEALVAAATVPGYVERLQAAPESLQT